jgi:hypothetical protein
MKDKLYPGTSPPENAQKRFFRRVPGSEGAGTLTPLMSNLATFLNYGPSSSF